MDMPVCITIVTEQDIVMARHIGRNIAKELQFGNITQSRIATAISELARNIYLYANEGTISLDTIEKEGTLGLRIEARDQGPGIPDIRLAMEDGFSTSGGLGAGLPGVKRLMDEFYIESNPLKGTYIAIVKWRGER
ncbi:anti-sigma regulatory factor [Brevibacillus sp. SYSU BS000544]|uniref:anti-sigma regulatory factor n=1 Tax=Brevibacillus sp. SYSU BS000544 TaxID=3416443 RepID=UPI003CE523C3